MAIILGGSALALAAVGVLTMGGVWLSFRLRHVQIPAVEIELRRQRQALVDQLELPWDAFRLRLVDAIAAAPDRAYYESWAVALESLAVDLDGHLDDQ